MKAHTMKHRSLRVILLAASFLVLLARGGSAQTVEYEYYHLDALGSVRAVTNQSGAVIERHDYLPFGEEVNAPANANPRQFTGKERDAETGLDYFGARYYSGKRARFATIDPVYTWQENLSDPQRWNRYAYARNNPLRYTDPDGREIWSPFQSAKPADFAVLGDLVQGVATGVANYFIGLNSPGHQPADQAASRLYSPSSTAQAIGMVAADLALLAGGARASGRGTTTEVIHFTDAAGKAGIEASGSIRAGSWVTKPSEVRGLSSAAQIERRLEIDPGKGAHSFTARVPTSSLKVPANGPKTSGQAWQRRLTEPAQIKKE